MTTIDPSKVKAGDTVTLTGPAKRAWVAGPVSSVTHVGGGEWDIRIDGLSTYRVGRIGVWTLTDHQPAPVPEWEPGTAGKATVRGIKGVRVMRTSGTGGADVMWLSASMVSGVRGHREGEVTDFVPDDASRWAAQAKLVEVDLDNARAEVERWKAEAEMLTAKVDRLMPLQEHENECAYRQRAEKAEAEVERLRAARPWVTRREIADAIWPKAPESVRDGLAKSDVVRRVHDLINGEAMAETESAEENR